MKKIYVVSYEDDMEMAFENLADAEEYIFHESYLEAMGLASSCYHIRY